MPRQRFKKKIDDQKATTTLKSSEVQGNVSIKETNGVQNVIENLFGKENNKLGFNKNNKQNEPTIQAYTKPKESELNSTNVLKREDVYRSSNAPIKKPTKNALSKFVNKITKIFSFRKK